MAGPTGTQLGYKGRMAELTDEPLFSTPGRWRTVRDAIKGLSDPREKKSHQNHFFQPGAKSYPGHTGSLLDEPAKALKAGDHGVPGGENMLRYPNGRVRYFTVRESARIPIDIKNIFKDQFLPAVERLITFLLVKIRKLTQGKRK